MANYLMAGAFALFLKLVIPIVGGAFLGGLVATFVQSFLASDDRTFGFVGRFTGGLLGLYLSIQLLSSLLIRYAERLWGGVDMFK